MEHQIGKQLHNYPKPQLTAEEQAFLDGPVEEVLFMTNDFQITHELVDLPPEIWQYLKRPSFLCDDYQKRVWWI